MPMCKACEMDTPYLIDGLCEYCYKDFGKGLQQVTEAEIADMANEAHITIQTKQED